MGNPKIRLLVDLPIATKHGAVKGAVFAVTRRDKIGRDRRIYFVGNAGEECAAYAEEYE